MKVRSIFLLLLFCIGYFCPLSWAKPKKPDWVLRFGTSARYPASLYLKGFGICNGADSESKEIAQDNARADLSRKIRISINSMLTAVREEKNRKYSQELSAVTQTSTSLELIGLETELFVDDDKKKPATYALAYIQYSTLNEIYSQKRREVRKEIRKIIQLAESPQQKSQAVNFYLQTLPFFEELKEIEIILSVARQFSSIIAAFDELEGEDEAPLMSRMEVVNAIQQLVLKDIKSLSDIAQAIAFQFSQQADISDRQVMVVPFTYQDTRMTSRFSRYLKRELEVKVSNTVSGVNRFQAKSVRVTHDLAVASGADSLLTGSYWEQGDTIQVLAVLRDMSSGKCLASAQVDFPSEFLPENVGIKPQNFEQAMVQQQSFAEGEIASAQLQLEVWTGKGSENVLFSEDEDVKIYLRVNREAYVRLLYILADGSKTLLFDGLYIDQSKVNRVVEVPEVFMCADPFGAEILIGVARTAPFDFLKTVERNGYLYVVSGQPEEVPDLLRGTKGLKRRKREDPEIQQTEDKLIITTVSK